MAQAYYWLLSVRDANKDSYNPYARAFLSKAKTRMMQGGETDIALALRIYVEGEARSVVTYLNIKEGIEEALVKNFNMDRIDAQDTVRDNTKQISALVKGKYGLCNQGKKMKVDGLAQYVFAIRDQGEWVDVVRQRLHAELESATPF